MSHIVAFRICNSRPWMYIQKEKKNVYGEMKNTYLTVQNTNYKQKIQTTRPENYIKLGVFPDHAPETV